MPNPFFKNHGPFKISDLINLLNLNIENLNGHSGVSGPMQF